LLDYGIFFLVFISHVGGRYIEELTGIRIKNITLDDNGEYTCRAEVEGDGRYNERKIHVLVHSEFSLRYQIRNIANWLFILLVSRLLGLDGLSSIHPYEFLSE